MSRRLMGVAARWAGETLAHVAVAQQLVAPLSPGTIQPWRRADTITPWRYHAWPPSTDPPCVDKAAPGLVLYQHAPAWAAPGDAVVCREETTSIQAHQRVSATQAAAPGSPVHVAAQEKPLALAFDVRISWLPPHASWRDQGESMFSKGQREVLPPKVARVCWRWSSICRTLLLHALRIQNRCSGQTRKPSGSPSSEPRSQ